MCCIGRSSLNKYKNTGINRNSKYDFQFVIRFKIHAFFIITLFIQLYVRVDILLTHMTALFHHKMGSLDTLNCLALSLFIEVPVPSQEMERSCICVRV
jgi:hypothetical protein